MQTNSVQPVDGQSPGSQSPDFMVIGAGPAGAMATFLLARTGAEVVLTERAEFPRLKVCGGCLAQTGFNILRRHLLHTLPSLIDAMAIERLDLRSANQNLNLQVEPYRVIERSAFDHNLVCAAVAAGANFLPNMLAHVHPDYSVQLSNSQTLHPRVIIVADGLKGNALRKLPGFQWRIDPRARVGMGAILDALPPGCSSDAITMLHDTCGYAGFAPLQGGRALVAAAVDPEWVRTPRNMPPLLALMREMDLSIGTETNLQTTGGAPGLTRMRDTIEADGRVFLIGDATGYIEPFTGEGMTWALQDACMITKHALAALNGNYSKNQWAAHHRQINRRRKALCRLSSRLLRKPRLTRALMSASSRSPRLGRALTGTVRAMQQQELTESSSV